MTGGAVLVLAVMTAILVWASGQGANTPSNTPTTTPAQVPLDQADPKVAGCADAVTVDSIEVYDPPQHLAGTLQLRFSPVCGSSWSRFEPTAGLATTPPLTLELNVRRPGDGAVAPFQVTFDGQEAYGNILTSNQECVFAEVIFHRGDAVSPTFRTSCHRGAG